MITTVIFDLDDTLYDEIDYCKSGFMAIAEFLTSSVKHRASSIEDALWKQFTAGNHTKTFNAALEEFGIAYDDKLIRKLIETYRNHIPKITLPQESREALRKLNGKYTLALLTDGFLPAQRLKVQALDIEKYFKCIIYTEQLGRSCWKPSPAGFEKLMQDLNAKPAGCAYVADNEEKDFIAPNKLGFSTIQLIRPARIHTAISAESGTAAQYTIHKISDLPALLEKL